MTSDDITDYVITHHGDLSPYTDRWYMQFNKYIEKHQNEIDKMFLAVNADYNPLDNNDVTTETVILNKTDKTETTPVTSKVKQYDKSFDGGLENTAYTESEVLTSGSVNPNNTLSETFQTDQNTGYNNTSKTLERKHGNISSITNQSIITQEIDLRLKEWLEPLIDKAVLYGGVYYDNNMV